MVHSFIEKITPFLKDEDKIVREYASFMLHEYPFTPSELVNQQLADALNAQEEERNSLLIWGQQQHVNEDTLPILLKLLRKISKKDRHLVLKYVINLPAQSIVDAEKDLVPYIGEDFIAFSKMLLTEDDEDKLWESFTDVIQNVDSDGFNALEFQKAKKMQDVLIAKGYFTKQNVTEIFEELEAEDALLYRVLAVRAVGILELTEYMQAVVELLDREEDILLQEAFEALSRFQSEEVVDLVAPYAMRNDTYIYAMSVLKETKTAGAVNVLVEAYSKVDEGGKEVALEALAAHFTEKAIPLIEDFHQTIGYSGELAQTFYSFYKMMDKTHPAMEEWKEAVLAMEAVEEASMKQATPVVSEKIGRNDPCTCGSGKKYKKCCGQ